MVRDSLVSVHSGGFPERDFGHPSFRFIKRLAPTVSENDVDVRAEFGNGVATVRLARCEDRSEAGGFRFRTSETMARHNRRSQSSVNKKVDSRKIRRRGTWNSSPLRTSNCSRLCWLPDRIGQHCSRFEAPNLAMRGVGTKRGLVQRPGKKVARACCNSSVAAERDRVTKGIGTKECRDG